MTSAQRRALASLRDAYALSGGLARPDLEKAFGRSAPICVEIGSGDGECIVRMATQHQDNDYVAVEVHRPGLGRLLNQVATLDVRNIRVVDYDATDFLESLSDNCLTAVYVFFPDPWPKKRHHKRRLINPALLSKLQSKLARHGRLYVATDCSDYAEHISNTVQQHRGWINLAGDGQTAPRPKDRVLTRFEQRGIRAGHTIADFVFARA